MDSTETNNSIDQRIERLNQRFSETYYRMEIDGRSFFIPKTERVFAFAVGYIWTDCLVLEYAETEDDLRVNRLEDGDSFSMDMTEDAMYEAMIAEIES